MGLGNTNLTTTPRRETLLRKILKRVPTSHIYMKTRRNRYELLTAWQTLEKHMQSAANPKRDTLFCEQIWKGSPPPITIWKPEEINTNWLQAGKHLKSICNLLRILSEIPLSDKFRKGSTPPISIWKLEEIDTNCLQSGKQSAANSKRDTLFRQILKRVPTSHNYMKTWRKGYKLITGRQTSEKHMQSAANPKRDTLFRKILKRAPPPITIWKPKEIDTNGLQAGKHLKSICNLLRILSETPFSEKVWKGSPPPMSIGKPKKSIEIGYRLANTWRASAI